MTRASGRFGPSGSRASVYRPDERGSMQRANRAVSYASGINDLGRRSERNNFFSRIGVNFFRRGEGKPVREPVPQNRGNPGTAATGHLSRNRYPSIISLNRPESMTVERGSLRPVQLGQHCYQVEFENSTELGASASKINSVEKKIDYCFDDKNLLLKALALLELQTPEDVLNRVESNSIIQSCLRLYFSSQYAKAKPEDIDAIVEDFTSPEVLSTCARQLRLGEAMILRSDISQSSEIDIRNSELYLSRLFERIVAVMSKDGLSNDQFKTVVYDFFLGDRTDSRCIREQNNPFLQLSKWCLGTRRCQVTDFDNKLFRSIDGKSFHTSCQGKKR